MAQLNEDHQELLFKYRMATVKPDLETCQNLQINSYVTCHIKCIDGEHGELLQVSAVSRLQSFNKYVKHQGQISAKVAQQTGLEMKSGKLWRFDKVVKSFRSVKSTMKLLLEWLETLDPPILLIGSCDWYPLLREIQAHELIRPFENIVMGLCDARDLFKEGKNKRKLSIQELGIRLLEGCNKDNETEKAVDDCDGLNYVNLLQSMLDKKVCKGGIKESMCHINKTSFDFKSSMLHAEYITAGERNLEFEWHNRSLKNAAISNQIAKQIAYSGLNFKDIWLMYKKWGMAGIRRCFTSKVKKKFRVTSNEKSICSVIGCLASQHQLDEHEGEHECLQPVSALSKTTQTLLTEAQLQNPVATLDVSGEIHKIYPGENKIGCNPSTCTVLMQSQMVCAEQAILKVTGDSHFITHLGGPNSVWVGKVKLKEKMPYPLRGGEFLKFGDMCGKYIICTRGEHDVTCSAVQSLLKNELLCLCPFLHNIENPAEFPTTQMGSSDYEAWQTSMKYILERINIFISTHPKNHLPYVALACSQIGSIVVPNEASGGGLHWSAGLSASLSSVDDVSRSAMGAFLTWLQQGFSSGVPVLVVAHHEHLTQLQASLATTAHVIHHATATRFIQYLIRKSTGRDIEIVRNQERNDVGSVVYMQNLLSNMYLELRKALVNCKQGLLRDLLELLAKVMDKLGFGGVLYLLTILYDQPQCKDKKKKWENSSHSTLCEIKSEKIVDSEISVICIDDDSDEDMNSLPDISPKTDHFKSKLKYNEDDEDEDVCIIEECKKEDSSICIDLDSDSGEETENSFRNKQSLTGILNNDKPKNIESKNNVSVKGNSSEKQNSRLWKNDSEQVFYKNTDSKSRKKSFMVNVENRVNELLGGQNSALKRKMVSEEDIFGESLSDTQFLTEEELFGTSSEETNVTEVQINRAIVEESSYDSDELYGKCLKKVCKRHVTEEELFGSNSKKIKVLVTEEDLFGFDVRKENVMVSEEDLFGKTTGQKIFGSIGTNLEKQRICKVDQQEISLNANKTNQNKQKIREEQESKSKTLLKKLTTKNLSDQSLVDENIQTVTENELFGLNSNEPEKRNEHSQNPKYISKDLKTKNKAKGIYINKLKKLDEGARCLDEKYRDVMKLEGKQSKSCPGKNKETLSKKEVFRLKEDNHLLQKEQRTNESCISYEELTVEDLFETNVEDTNIQLVTEEDLFVKDSNEFEKEPRNKKLHTELGTEKNKTEGNDIQQVTQEELFGRDSKEFNREPQHKKPNYDTNIQLGTEVEILGSEFSKLERESKKKKIKEHGTEKAKNIVTDMQIVTEELLFGSVLNKFEKESENNKLEEELGTEKAQKIKVSDEENYIENKIRRNEKSKLYDKIEVSGRISHENATNENKMPKKIRKELGKIEKKHEKSNKEDKGKADIIHIPKNRENQPLRNYKFDDHHIKTVDNKRKTSCKNKFKSNSWNVTDVSEQTETHKCTEESEKSQTNNCTKISDKYETSKCTKVTEKAVKNKCINILEKYETKKYTKESDKNEGNKCTMISEEKETKEYANVSGKIESIKCTKVSEKNETNKCQEVIDKNEKNKQQEIGKTVSKSTRKMRPFNLLMRGVIFKVVGFQNESYNELKEMMETMGAQHLTKKDHADFTHIICASQVLHLKFLNKKKKMRKMRTVTEDWVRQAFCNKKRYPWRQFSFERCKVAISLSKEREKYYKRDNVLENSEDEIWAEELREDSSRLKNHNEWKCMESDKKELRLLSRTSEQIENEPEKVQILLDKTTSNMYDPDKPDIQEILQCEHRKMQPETLQDEQKLMQPMSPDQNCPLGDTGIKCTKLNFKYESFDDITEEDIREYFSQFGKVVDCDIPEMKDDSNFNISFVEFEKSDGAENALKHSEIHDIKGNVLIISLKPDSNKEPPCMRVCTVRSQEVLVAGSVCEGNDKDAATVSPVCDNATTTKDVSSYSNELLSQNSKKCIRDYYHFCNRQRLHVKRKNGAPLNNYEVNKMMGEWLSNLQLPAIKKTKYKYSEHFSAWRYITEFLRANPGFAWKSFSEIIHSRSSPSIYSAKTEDTIQLDRKVSLDNAASVSLSLASSNVNAITTSIKEPKLTTTITFMHLTDASLDSLQANDTASYASPDVTKVDSPKNTDLKENQHQISSTFSTPVISSNVQETDLPDDDKNIACSTHLKLAVVAKEPKIVSEEITKIGFVHKKWDKTLSHIERHTLPLEIIKPKFDDAPSVPVRTAYELFMQKFKKDSGADFTITSAREFWKKKNRKQKHVYALCVNVLKQQSKDHFLSYVRSLESQQRKIFVGVNRAKLLPYFQEDIFAEEYPGADYPILLYPKKGKTMEKDKDAQASVEASKQDMQIHKSPQIKVKSFDQLTEKGIVPLDSDFPHYEGFGVGLLSSGDMSVNWTCPTTVSEYDNISPYEEDNVYSDSEECQMDATEIDLTNESSCLTNESSGNETFWNDMLWKKIPRHEDIRIDHDDRNPLNDVHDCNSEQGTSSAVITTPILRGKSTKTKENQKSLKKSIKELKKYVSRTKCQENWQPAFQNETIGIELLELMKQLELKTPHDNSCDNLEQESLIYLMTHEVSPEKSGNESDLEIITPDSSGNSKKESEINLLLTSHDDLSEKSEKESEIDLMTEENFGKEAERSDVYEGFTMLKKIRIPNVKYLDIPEQVEEIVDTNIEIEFDFEGFTDFDIECGKFAR